MSADISSAGKVFRTECQAAVCKVQCGRGCMGETSPCSRNVNVATVLPYYEGHTHVSRLHKFCLGMRCNYTTGSS